MNRTTFKKILYEQKDRIYSYALYFLRNRDDAEDVTQEVFCKLWQSRDKIDQKRVAAWLMRVTHNQCIDVCRKRKAKMIHEVDFSRMDIEKMESESEQFTNPELDFEFSETQKILLESLDILPEQTRSMMLLHYYQGMKYEVIGKILDTKVNTIKVAIHRGKKVLKSVLKEKLPSRVGEDKNVRSM